MTTAEIARARARQITVERVDPALMLAVAWAGANDDRWQTDVLAAFVELVRTLDQYQRETRS